MRSHGSHMMWDPITPGVAARPSDGSGMAIANRRHEFLTHARSVGQRVTISTFLEFFRTRRGRRLAAGELSPDR